MKIKYVDEYMAVLHIADFTDVPRIGEKVNVNEVFYVLDVIWQPLDSSIVVVLTESEPKLFKDVSESKESSTPKSPQDVLIKTNEILKEIKSIKGELLNVKQYVKAPPKK